MHAAFKSVFESSLAAPARMDLCFNNNINIAELSRDLLCLIECGSHSAARRSDIELLQQFFGLMFVDVHPENAAFSVRRLSISERVE